MADTTKHVALYAGSFDPITYGHLDVVSRARTLFDELVLGLGNNPEKPAVFSFEERREMIGQLVDDMLAEAPDGAPVRVESYTGLTVDFARQVGASAILRGIRNVTDLAMECQLAITNRQVAEIETVFMITGERYAFTSSSLIRQVAALGGSLDRLTAIVPQIVIDRMKEKMRSEDNPLARMARDEHID
ncbi:MAG: pantetheine-phosphate adenylyltransferase [Planctomycetes bacterium]|nr:pantetheine-phosphate adenylyltransferase [Planctomycetota bacterium]